MQTGLFRIDRVEQHGGSWVLWFGYTGDKALVYQLSDSAVQVNFNIWSWRQVNDDWHVVIED